MSILSLLLGIITLVAALMPGCHYIFLVVCCIGVATGIIALHEHKDDPGISITAIVFNGYATILILMWSFTLAIGTIDVADEFIEPASIMQQPPVTLPTFVLQKLPTPTQKPLVPTVPKAPEPKVSEEPKTAK